MIKHNFSQEGYHPKEVSFEVEAMLLDEAKEFVINSTFTGTASDGYSRAKARAFDPLEDEKTVDEYIKYQHERDMVYKHFVDKLEEQKREGKRFRSWKAGAMLAALSVKKRFMSVIESMIADNYVDYQELDIRQRDEYKKKVFVESKRYQEALRKRGVMPLDHENSSHVNALRHERAQVRYREL